MATLERGKKSIKRDILIFFAGSVVVMTLLIVAINGLFLSVRLKEIRSSEISNIFNYHLLKINEINTQMELNVLSLAHVGEILYNNANGGSVPRLFSTINRYLADQVKEIPIILGGGLWYEPYTLIPSMKYVGPYAYWDGDSVTATWEYSNKQYDYVKHNWYRIAIPDGWNLSRKREKKVYVTPPYLDSLNRKDVIFISMSAPMYSAAGKIIGVATTDWSLDVIKSTLMSFVISPNSIVFLADKETGMILYHPNEHLLMKRLDTVEWGRSVDLSVGGKNLVKEKNIEINGNSFILRHAETTSGFVFGALIAQDEIYKPINQFIIINIVIAIIFVLFLGIWIYVFISRYVISPITALAGFGKELADGNLEKHLAPLRDDELGALVEDFNVMASRLDESTSSIRSIIEFMPSMIIQISGEGKIIRWNKLADEIFAGKMDTIHEVKISEIETPLSRFSQEVTSVCDTGIPATFYREKLEGFNGKLFNMYIFPISLRQGKFAVMRIDDITDIEAKNEQLRRAQKLESLGLLAGGIAHDFNNILCGIMGTVSLLRHRIKRKGVPSIEDLERDLGVIESGSEAGASIVSQLLDIAKQGKDTDVVPVDLADITRRIVKISSKSFDRSIEVKVAIPEESCMILGNSSQLQQCVLNLCVNGAQAMTIMRKQGEKPGGVLFVEIDRIIADRYFVELHHGSRLINYWRLTIRDTGVGIDKKTLTKIFDPFFSTKDRGQGRGTGLGLSVVYSIVTGHGGFIDVYSEPGLGSSFNIYFPIYYEDQITNNKGERDSEPTIAIGSGTILVIDDDDAVRESARSMLEECGFKVITADGGERGLQLFKQEHDIINAVLLDLVMPGMSGTEVLREIIEIKPDTEVFIMSGLYSKELVDQLVNAGARDFIQKPFTLSSLSQKICGPMEKKDD